VLGHVVVLFFFLNVSESDTAVDFSNVYGLIPSAFEKKKTPRVYFLLPTMKRVQRAAGPTSGDIHHVSSDRN